MSPPTLIFGREEEELRGRIRAWLTAHDPGSLPRDYETQVSVLRAWQGELHRGGWIGLSWPAEYGGRGLPIIAEAVLAEELAHAGMPELINRVALYTVAPTLLDYGTEAQCRRLLPGMLDASEIWCQGFSEPNAGSDLAALTTKGRLENGHLVVTGQKVWTSRSNVARWCAALIRTEAGSSRHRGLSLVGIDMEAPGVTVRPLLQAMHEPHFGEVFFDGVPVPLECVIGPIDGGWRVAMAMLGYERGLFVLERQTRLRRRLEQLADLILARGRDDMGAAERLGTVVGLLELLRAQVYRTLAEQAAGTLPVGASSVDKLLLADVDQRLFALATGELSPTEALMDNEWTHDLLGSRAVSIYSGTSQIQRNIIASKLLGLETGGTNVLGSALQRGLDAVVARSYGVPQRLESAADDRPVPETIIGALSDAGWGQIAISEAAGGLGLPATDLAELCQVVGARLIPAALREEAILLGPLLEALAHHERRARAGAMLDEFLRGSIRGGGAVVLDPSSSLNRLTERECELTLDRAPAWLVPGARLVAIRSSAWVALVDLGVPGLEVVARQALEPGQGFHVLRCNRLRLPVSAIVDGDAAAAITHRHRTALTAEAVGLADAVLAQAVDYGRTREQFGRPISSFQSVAHLLADAKAAVEVSRSGLARVTAMTPPSWVPDGATELLALCLAHAVPASARAVCETAIQVHGGVGFTWEYGLHLHYRRALQLQTVLGGARESAVRIGQRYLDERRRQHE